MMGWTGGFQFVFRRTAPISWGAEPIDLLEGVACHGVNPVANPPESVCPLSPRLRVCPSATTRPGERTGRSINAYFFRCVPGSLSGEYRWGAHRGDSLLGSIQTIFGPGIRNLRSAAGIFGSLFVNLGA